MWKFWQHSWIYFTLGAKRAFMYFPVILSAVVVGFIWVLIYNTHWGLLNTLLAAVGLARWQRDAMTTALTGLV